VNSMNGDPFTRGVLDRLPRRSANVRAPVALLMALASGVLCLVFRGPLFEIWRTALRAAGVAHPMAFAVGCAVGALAMLMLLMTLREER